MKRLFGAAKADIEAEARALRIEVERARLVQGFFLLAAERFL